MGDIYFLGILKAGRLIKLSSIGLIIVALMLNWKILSYWEEPLAYIITVFLNVFTVSFSVYIIHMVDVNGLEEEKQNFSFNTIKAG